jgi:hypothetical protein
MNSIINLKKTNLEKEYFLLKSLIFTLDSKFKHENEEIITTIKHLETEVPIYVENISNLNSEITRLRAVLQVQNPSTIVHDVEEHKPEAENLDIKHLYRLISSKCHPDKTDDTSLHELFMAATDAYRSHSYSMVLEIYYKLKEVNSSSSFMFSDITIEQKLEIIKKEYAKKKDEYNKLSTTNGYIINTFIKNKQVTQARKIFLDLIFNQTLELERLKQQLENNLNNKEQKNEIQQQQHNSV